MEPFNIVSEFVTDIASLQLEIDFNNKEAVVIYDFDNNEDG